MNAYIDESGDLGFSFQRPFRTGGSSRYLTISILLIPKNLSHLPKRIVRRLYKDRRRSPENELKGVHLSDAGKSLVAENTIKLLRKHSNIKIMAITVDKRNVKKHIRNDQNKLYNYMIGLILLPKIKNKKKITLIPDKKSIKVASGNSLIDYLKIKLWFDFNSETSIDYTPLESHTALNLQYIDWISHIIWNSYEDSESEILEIFREKIELSNLFF